MIAHLAGSAETAVRFGLLVLCYGSSGVRAARGPLEFVDYMCAWQIARRRAMSNDQIVSELRRWAPQVPARLSGHRLLRRLPIPAGAGLAPGATVSTFLDVIHLRDVWLHRIDLVRATGRERVVTRAEGEVVRQVVRDLDLTWTGPPVVLTLTGPGGGVWQLGRGTPTARVEEDAIAYLRLLSGRSDECTLRTDGDPSATTALRQARVLF